MRVRREGRYPHGVLGRRVRHTEPLARDGAGAADGSRGKDGPQAGERAGLVGLHRDGGRGEAGLRRAAAGGRDGLCIGGPAAETTDGCVEGRRGWLVAGHTGTAARNRCSLVTMLLQAAHPGGLPSPGW